MNSSFSKHHPLFLQSFLWLLLWNVVLLQRCSYGTFSQLFQKQNWNYHCIRNKLHILLSNLPASTEISFNGRSLTQFRPVTEDTVRCTILGSLSKMCELDVFPTPLLLECLGSLLPCITAVFNNSLVSGVFPSAYKSAPVKPLLKKMPLDPSDLKNYRSVSNLPFLSKVLDSFRLS